MNSEPTTVTTLTAIEFAKKAKQRWTIQLHPDHLALSTESESQPLIYPRALFEDKIKYIEGTRLIAIKFPREINLQLEAKAVRTFWQWWRPPTLENLKAALKKRYNYTWVLGLFFLLIASAGPVKSFYSIFLYAMCGTALAVSIFSKFNPRPIAFLLDTIWWSSLTVLLLWRVYRGDSYFWLLLIFLNLITLTQTLKLYRHYASVKPAADSASR